MRRFFLAGIVCLLLLPALRAQSGNVQRLEIFPADRVLHSPHKTQQLAVIAHFKDGSRELIG